MPITLHHKVDSKLAQDLRIQHQEWVVDVSAAEGGDDLGPSPHDLYDAALGACKALTVMWYARKKGLLVDDIHTEVDHDNTQERQGIYRLSTKLVITGDLSDTQMKELAAVAQKCPVHKLMTEVKTEITTTVVRADAPKASL